MKPVFGGFETLLKFFKFGHFLPYLNLEMVYIQETGHSLTFIINYKNEVIFELRDDPTLPLRDDDGRPK